MASWPFVSSGEGHAVNNHTVGPKRAHSTRIHRLTYVIWLVLFYAALVLFSWIVICKLNYRPITANHYGVWVWNDDNNGYGWSHDDVIQAQYQRNEKWYKAAQVIQSVASVLTIPLTSAVCSSAAVVYLQHCNDGRTPRFTLRQMTVLADKGWTDIETYFRLLTGRFRRYGSTFLLWAVLLHAIGAIIAPLQQIFLSTKTIKTPTYPVPVNFLLDIPDKFEHMKLTELGTGATVSVVRDLLASTSGNDFPALLWAGSNNCIPMDNITMDEGMLCTQGGVSWGNLSILSDPFLAQLPRDYNTGLIQQFLPRFNSTARYEIIPVAEFPTDCDTIPGALSIRHMGSPVEFPSQELSWAVHACMPVDLRVSPWKKTRARQDFTEDLYLNVSLSNDLLFNLMAENPSSPFSE
ncbi:hypothetical protein ASPWEDRAFT_700754 [Aspergillus wentii DTO 134E9]|uniref:Uncharacterized protein n=1 Tax=Aspergillus wentii DTO 134E9 TaxID=1073089 RepID=A0A1L9R5G4_ASPWE|nr:uncharacterized protein ASPWEDRAFT_700754 [Aspergillus wentii DTO 134E9]KAI9923767.1 hypothetical protein MW887_008395 [Aspergillus wentii]OJJ30127.1 hypothetical protein ASPWEDRAFT_700754 [Aspergillus wentii DTO 134E9]